MGGAEVASEEGPVQALTAYLEARKAGDYGTAYKYLSQSARDSYDESEMKTYYESIIQFGWGRLGEPKAVQEDWVRIIVYDITATMSDNSTVVEPEYPYYLQQSDGKWGVALVNPLVGRIGTLHRENGTAQELYDLTLLILKVNPWSYRAHLEQYFLFMGAGDAEAAAAAIDKLYLLATPADLPEVNALRGEFMVELGNQPAEGRDALKLALDMGATYPERYTNIWRAYTMLELARAYRSLTEHEAAKKTARDAYQLDPNNRLIKEFLAQYGVLMP